MEPENAMTPDAKMPQFAAPYARQPIVLAVIASEAKQPKAPGTGLDRFVATLLAMTNEL
jgi:hypothetical protein